MYLLIHSTWFTQAVFTYSAERIHLTLFTSLQNEILSQLETAV